MNLFHSLKKRSLTVEKVRLQLFDGSSVKYNWVCNGSSVLNHVRYKKRKIQYPLDDPHRCRALWNCRHHQLRTPSRSLGRIRLLWLWAKTTEEYSAFVSCETVQNSFTVVITVATVENNVWRYYSYITVATVEKPCSEVLFIYHCSIL